MAPPLKISKEEIVEAARALIREKGPAALNARDLGGRLGLSARPIYSHFASMDELRELILNDLFAEYFAFLTKPQGTGDRFLDIGMAQLRWARAHPVEYRILQDPLSLRSGSVGSAALSERLLDYLVGTAAAEPYRGLDRGRMESLLLPMAVFTHGLADLVNRGLGAELDDGRALALLRRLGAALMRYDESAAKAEGGSE